MSSSGSGWPLGSAEGDEPGAAGYEWSEPTGRSGGPYSEGPDDEYGRGAGRSGRHSAVSPYQGGNYGGEAYGDDYRQDWATSGGYEQDPSGRGRYDTGAGQGWYGQEPAGGSYGDPRYGADGGDRDGYGRDGYGREGYGGDGYGQPGYERDGYGRGDYERGSYGQEQYGQDAYGRPGDQGGYGGGEYYEQAPYRDDESGRGGYGQDAYEQETHGYGSNGRSFDGRDSGWSDRPDTGSFGAADGYQQDTYQSSYGLPAETVRRAEAGDDAGYGQWQGAHDGADSWHNEQADEEWQDDRGDDGLLSSRFSRDVSSRSAGRRAGRAKRQRRTRGKFATIAAVLAGALVLGAVADYGYEKYKEWHLHRYGDYSGYGFGQVHFQVKAGAALSSLGPALQAAGVIEELRPYNNAANSATNASALQPGTYLLHKHMNSAIAVQWLLSSAHRTNNQLLIIEGLRASNIAGLLAKYSGLPASQFTQIINHPPKALGLPSWVPAGKSAEGFLFPNTYTFAPKMTALQILQLMVSQFKTQIASINLVADARAIHTSPWHVLIVASLAQAEAGNKTDLGKISDVVWNRLQQGMKLQFDSTVFYAMKSYGTYVKTLAEKNFPSPYNTYLHAGLPPGPIGNPGIAAITAALHPPQDGYLYFITDTRNKHKLVTHFTASYSQFQAWQREFQG